MGKLFLIPSDQQSDATRQVGERAKEIHGDAIRLTIMENNPACHRANGAFFQGHGTPSVSGTSYNTATPTVEAGILMAFDVERHVEGPDGIDARDIARDLKDQLHRDGGAAAVFASSAVLQPVAEYCHAQCQEHRQPQGLPPSAHSFAGAAIVIHCSNGQIAEVSPITITPLTTAGVPAEIPATTA